MFECFSVVVYRHKTLHTYYRHYCKGKNLSPHPLHSHLVLKDRLDMIVDKRLLLNSKFYGKIIKTIIISPRTMVTYSHTQTSRVFRL